MQKFRGLEIEVWVLVVLALAMYLPAYTWGIASGTGPEQIHAWGNDDASPLAALAEMHDTFVVEPPNRNVAYPWFHYFLMGASSAPYLLYERLTGGFNHPSSVYPYGFRDPAAAFRRLSWIVRFWSMLLAVAAVLGAYYIGKNMWNRRAGFLAGIFTMLLFPLAYYAKLTNPDAPVLGWTSMGLAVLALCHRHGMTPRRCAWLGTLVALAATTKDQSVGSFALAAPVVLWLHLRHGKPAVLRGWTSLWAAPVAGAVSFVIVYVIASGIPVDPGRYRGHVAKTLMVGVTHALYLRHPRTLEGTMAQMGDQFGYLLDVMTWPLFLLALAGIVIALRKDRLPLALLLSSVGFFVMLLPVGLCRIHYLLPVALPLTAFAGFAVDRVLSTGGAVRWAAVALTIGISGLMFLRLLDLTHDMLYDSRYAASEWLDHQTHAGDRVMHFGFSSKMPHIRADVQQLRIIPQVEALPSIQRDRPEFIVVVPQDINDRRERVEWREGLSSVIMPLYPAVFEQLVNESMGYRLVARFQTPRLLGWLDRPFLSYPTVNPPVQIFARADRAAGMPKLEPWREAPYYSRFIRVRDVSVEYSGGGR